MTREELAALLNGRECGSEVPPELEVGAKAADLVVIFGASDDLVELRGGLHDEAGAYGGAVLRIDAQGFVPVWEEIDRDSEKECANYFARKGKGALITAHWDKGNYSWVIETTVPHATFDIVEGDEKFCRGIVIARADLGAP